MALTDDAPISGEEVPAVADQAPPAGDAVSSDGQVAPHPEPEHETVVPAQRFNGLMRSYHKLSEELAQERKLREELEARLARSDPKENPVSDLNAEELAEQVRQMREILVAERLERERSRVLDRYPLVKPFADLLVGETPEELDGIARVLNDRLVATFGEPQENTPEAETTEPETPSAEGEEQPDEAAPPVIGSGGAHVDESHEPQSRVVEALKSGNFAEYLRAKWEAATA